MGSSYIMFRCLVGKGKIIIGSMAKYFQGARETWSLFSGSKGALTPLSGKASTKKIRGVTIK